ncbi:hypothetical protein JOB18_036832 [Solea senegalensis]|uniref:Uncharacterized protein n=1 Tax=Solea senegalensis TaxID=28829 RepID=A0AAV6QJE7_SOLSE|nr:hypothetical protein JOB18_036832 [Solea senegalensis]
MTEPVNADTHTRDDGQTASLFRLLPKGAGGPGLPKTVAVGRSVDLGPDVRILHCRTLHHINEDTMESVARRGKHRKWSWGVGFANVLFIYDIQSFF